MQVTKYKDLISNPDEIVRRIDWFFNANVFKRKYIKRKLKHITMLLDTQTQGISKTLATKGVREEDMISLLEKYLKPGSTIIDCGSNIGFYPMLQAHIMENQGEIVCIEPDPRNYKLLVKNLELVDPRVKMHSFNIAISDKAGRLKLDVSAESNLNKITYSPENVTDGVKVIDVEVDTVDSIVKKLDLSPDFLRMDIEGHEVEVIAGMTDTIRNAKAGFIIFFELHPSVYNDDHSMVNQLNKLFEAGFECEVLVSAGVPQPKLYKDLGYTPEKVIKSDGMERGIYYNVSRDDAIKLATATPKTSRYILLKKNEG